MTGKIPSRYRNYQYPSYVHRHPSRDYGNFGYAYQVPRSGFLRNLKNFLTQFSDIFSEFSRYLAPAYHHDRCERSVHMRLYSMHKREFVSVFLGFLTCFGLALIIGVTGPPITVTVSFDARQDILANTSLAKNEAVLSTGPFAMKSPLLTTYAQQLWLIAEVGTSNNDDEVYDKTFYVNVALDGISEQHKPVTLLSFIGHHNRSRNLSCVKNVCQEFTVMHLGFLNYAHYIVTVRFYGLESFHRKYNISNLTFFFKTYNPEFTQIEIWFRFIFLLLTFIVICWFTHTLRKYSIWDWSMEQKWVCVLLPLLLLYDNPCFPLTLLWNSWWPGMLDAIFQSTFLCFLLMFWLCIYHGLRQTERRFCTFYLSKLIVVFPIWLCAIFLATWEKWNELRDPTYNHFVDTKNYESFKVFFLVSGLMYIVYLLLLIVKAYNELRSMQYFDMRLKFLTLLMSFVMLVTIIVTINRFGFGILEDNFVASLKTTYRSSAHFMGFYGLLNFYLYTMAYVYSPCDRYSHAEISVTKDNPAFSMINDSDEEVLFGDGSDREDTKRPLTMSLSNDYESD